MQKFFGMILIMAGGSTAALAAVTAPEIDPASAVSGLALLGGALLIFRANRRK